MLGSSHHKEVPFSADNKGSRDLTVSGESRSSVKPLDLRQLEKPSALDVIHSKENTEILRSSLTWQAFEKANPSMDCPSIVRLDQHKTITKDQVKEFFSANEKLK